MQSFKTQKILGHPISLRRTYKIIGHPLATKFFEAPLPEHLQVICNPLKHKILGHPVSLRRNYKIIRHPLATKFFEAPPSLNTYKSYAIL